MNHTPTTQPTADDEIISTIEEWEQRTSRSDEARRAHRQRWPQQRQPD